MAARLKYCKWGDKLWNTWRGMKERCTNPNHKNYNLYKGKLCKEWYTCNIFAEWAVNNGYKDGLTIDRIDSNKGYTPDNCQFITARENTIKGNKERRLKEYEYKGYMKTVKELSIISGLSEYCIRQRLQKMSAEEAVTKPHRYKK